MKRLSVIVALVLSACSLASQVSESEVSPQGLTLATFTADVDPQAGTITFRTEPTLAGQILAQPYFVIPEPVGVTVAGVGSAWFKESTEHECGLVPTWGQVVTVTNRYSGSYISGVYARITDFPSGTGNDACNPDAAPSGIASAKGTWYYGAVPGTSSLRSWTFNYTSASPFRFTGEIVAAKLTNASTGTAPIRGNGRPSGSATAFPTYNDSGTEQGIGFIAADGTVTRTTDLTGYPVAVAPDMARSRIWYAGLLGTVGFTDLSGGNDQHLNYARTTEVGLDVVADGTDSSIGWLLINGPGANGAIRKYTIGSPSTLSDATTFPGVPKAMAIIGSTLYVTNTSESTIDIWDTGTMARTPVATGAECSSPGSIMVGGDGNLWFTTPASVCKMTPAGVVSKVKGADSALGICTGSDGNVWFTSATGTLSTSGITRVVAAVEATPWVVNAVPALQAGTWPSCASGAGGFWMLANGGGTQAVKVEP